MNDFIHDNSGHLVTNAPRVKTINKRWIYLLSGLILIIGLVAFFFARIIFAEDPGLVASPSGYTNINRFTFTVTGDPIPGASKYQYRTGGDDPMTWLDFDPPLSTSVTIGPGNPHPEGAYQDDPAQANIFYFRALDSENNPIANSNLEKNYYYNTTPPQTPENVQITPETNEVNNFRVSWDPPSFYYGDAEKITYFYCINEIMPAEDNVIELQGTELFIEGPLATKVGLNVINIIAKDEAGNIDYYSASSNEFWAETAAPPPPNNIQIDDISSKDTNQYRLALSWDEPDLIDPGNFDGYKVYASIDQLGPFAYLATTGQTAYVHTGLAPGSEHFYYITATDLTKNESIPSEIIGDFATGRYTHPPAVTKETEANPKSSRATITWVTERAATSSIEFGKTNSLGMSVGNGIINYVTDHSVTVTNLEPNTTYYYKAVFIDPDGNVGQTEISSFKTEPSPIISNLNISDTTTNSMVISWETNKLSSGEVRYGTSQSYGTVVKEDAVKTLKHSIKITNLKEGTLYHIQIVETDDENNVFYSDDYKKETLPIPKISNIIIKSKQDTEEPTITVEYDTNVEATTYFTYEAAGSTKVTEYFDSEFTKNHLVEISNLKAETKYYLKIGGHDTQGNEALTESAEITTLSDTLPPKVISQTERKKVSGTGEGADSILTIKITTNEPTTAIAEVIKGVSDKGERTTSETSPLAINHTIIVKLRHQATPYNYTVKLRDSEGNETKTEIRNIISPKKINTPLDFLAEVFINKFNWLSNFIKI